jgi:hypothetical protein
VFDIRGLPAIDVNIYILSLCILCCYILTKMQTKFCRILMISQKDGTTNARLAFDIANYPTKTINVAPTLNNAKVMREREKYSRYK